MTSHSKLIYSAFLIITIIVIDQTAKIIALKAGLDTLCNRGFAFGIFQGFINGLISLLVLVFLIYVMFRQTKHQIWFALALVIGGGASNILDRLFRSCVLDFIKLPYWPAFNLADLTISLGVLILIFSIVRGQKGDKS